MKNLRIFHLKTFIFLVVKFSVYLNRLVLVMPIKDLEYVGASLELHHQPSLMRIHNMFSLRNKVKLFTYNGCSS